MQTSCLNAPDRTRLRAVDDSAPIGAVPSRFPSWRRIPPPPGACTPSTRGNSGTPRAAREKSRFYIPSGSGLRATAPLKKTFDFAMKFRHRGIVRLASGIEYDGPLRAQLVEMQAHRFAQAPLDPVAHHGFTERARQCETDPWTAALRLADTKSGEQRPTVAGTLIVNSSEVLRTKQADTFRKTSDGGLPLVTHSEFLAAGRPAARENGSSVLGFHPRTESVRFRAVAIIRLKSAFRHCCSII